MQCLGFGCDGLGLIRLEPGLSASSPCLALPVPAPPSLESGDLPETLPLLEHGLALEFYRLPAPWARLIATARARASARCSPLEPRPEPAGVWAPASVLAVWRVGSSWVGDPCQPSTEKEGGTATPPLRSPARAPVG